MPKDFADSKSQFLFLIMVCKMRNLSYQQIKEEIRDKIHQDISISTIKIYISQMKEADTREFHDLKSSNTEYISQVMELKKHMAYYRQLILSIFTLQEFKQYVNPRLIFKAVELLKSIDESEFVMLKQMPELFAWGGVKNQKTDAMFGEKNKDALEKTIDQFVISMDQIPVARDLEKMQKEVESKSLGAFQQESTLDKKSE